MALEQERISKMSEKYTVYEGKDDQLNGIRSNNYWGTWWLGWLSMGLVISAQV